MEQESPFDLLNECMSADIRVQVITRSKDKIFGFIKSYDRHCNLVMTDVEINGVSKKSYFMRGDGVVIITKMK